MGCGAGIKWPADCPEQAISMPGWFGIARPRAGAGHLLRDREARLDLSSADSRCCFAIPRGLRPCGSLGPKAWLTRRTTGPTKGCLGLTLNLPGADAIFLCAAKMRDRVHERKRGSCSRAGLSQLEFPVSSLWLLHFPIQGPHHTLGLARSQP